MARKLNIDVAIKMIPEFDGDRSSLSRFIMCYDIVDEELYPETDDELILNVIKTKLSGSAYNAIKHKYFADWKALKKILKDQFSEKRTIAQIQSALLNVRQYSNEDIRSYANRVERLLSELNDVCIEKEGEDDKAKQVMENLNSRSALRGFAEGLNSNVKLVIKVSRFTTLSSAIDTAVEKELINASSKPKFYRLQNKTVPKYTYCGKVGHKYENCFGRSEKNLPKFPQKEQKPNLFSKFK